VLTVAHFPEHVMSHHVP